MKGLCLTSGRAAGWAVPVASPGPSSVQALILRPVAPEKAGKERLAKEPAAPIPLAPQVSISLNS